MFALRLFLGRSHFFLGLFFVLVGFGSLATVAYAGNPCTPAASPKSCIDTASWAPGYAAARGCLSAAGHCGDSPASFMCCMPAPIIAADACGAAIQAQRDNGAALTSLEADVRPDWVCRIPPPGAAGDAACRHFSGCYTINPTAYCCPPNVGTPPGRLATSTDAANAAAANATTTPAQVADPGKPGPLGLPPCATSHDPAIAGQCTLDDIKTVAVNFANFLMGLAAAFFLAIFVWAGFKYIFFAYDSGVAADAKKMLTGSAIGMLLVLGAASMVRFVQTVATGRAPSVATQDRCVATQGQSFSCQNPATLVETRRQNCVSNLCSDATLKCCPLNPSSGAGPGSSAP